MAEFAQEYTLACNARGGGGMGFLVFPGERLPDPEFVEEIQAKAKASPDELIEVSRYYGRSLTAKAYAERLRVLTAYLATEAGQGSLDHWRRQGNILGATPPTPRTRGGILEQNEQLRAQSAADQERIRVLEARLAALEAGGHGDTAKAEQYRAAITKKKHQDDPA